MCLLAAVLRHPPLSDDELVRIRSQERLLEAEREKAGLPRYMAVDTRIRLPGPLPQFFDTDGTMIPHTSNLHPFGPKRRKYGLVHKDVDDGGVCIASQFAPCTPFCLLCGP